MSTLPAIGRPSVTGLSVKMLGEAEYRRKLRIIFHAPNKSEAQKTPEFLKAKWRIAFQFQAPDNFRRHNADRTTTKPNNERQEP